MLGCREPEAGPPETRGGLQPPASPVPGPPAPSLPAAAAAAAAGRSMEPAATAGKTAVGREAAPGGSRRAPPAL